jgi:hypothetical protein
MKKVIGTLIAAVSLVAVVDVASAKHLPPSPQPGPCFNVKRQCAPIVPGPCSRTSPNCRAGGGAGTGGGRGGTR